MPTLTQGTRTPTHQDPDRVELLQIATQLMAALLQEGHQITDCAVDAIKGAAALIAAADELFADDWPDEPRAACADLRGIDGQVDLNPDLVDYGPHDPEECDPPCAEHVGGRH